MWKTALMLVITIIIVPVIAFSLEPPLPSHVYRVLKSLIWIYGIAALLCFLVSAITDNYSQVDKLWSIMPIIYAWTACAMLNFEPRLLLMAILVSVWGLRLTANFARRGGYRWPIWRGEEDYRWAQVRKRPEFSASWAWLLFNFVFISFYQMGLILLFTLPIIKAADGSPLGILDGVLTLLFLTLVYLEAKADNQQWEFQTQKHSYLKTGQSLPDFYAPGFIQSGLWSVVRHPNYACEQALWIAFYLFSTVATGQWFNWSIMGALLLVILFRSSSNLSETLSSEKYPDYEAYQENVPRFIPNFKSNK